MRANKQLLAEAILKAQGSGLSFTPTDLLIENNQGQADLAGIENFKIVRPSSPQLNGYCIAAAVPLENAEISVIENAHE